MKKTTINVSLTRNPRYSEAKGRFNELQAEFNALERQRDDMLAGIGSLASSARNRIEEEATAMLSGKPAPDTTKSREDMIKSADELTHRLAVLREAVALQRRIVDEIQAQVGKAIAIDLLPQHKANVTAVIEALLHLNAALEAEAELRETLNDEGVMYLQGGIRPMPLGGVQTLANNQGRIFKYLMECYEHGYIKAADLPDVVRDAIPPPAKPEPKQVARPNPDGWLMA